MNNNSKETYELETCTSKIIKLLGNINFWGITISNLIIGYYVIFFEGSININQFFIFIILVILVFSFLFIKVNFSKKKYWKLVLYSFFTCIIIAFADGFVSGLISFKFNLLSALDIAIWRLIFAVPYILLAAIANFIWFFIEKEKYFSKKTNKIVK